MIVPSAGGVEVIGGSGHARRRRAPRIAKRLGITPETLRRSWVTQPR